MPALPWTRRPPIEPGRAITRRLQPLMGPTRFEFFPVPAAARPMTWDQMKAPVRAEGARP